MISSMMNCNLAIADAMPKPSLTATMLEGLREGVAKELAEDGLVTVDTADDYDFIDDINEDLEDGVEVDDEFCKFCSSSISEHEDFKHVLERTVRRLWRSEDEYNHIPNPHLPSFDVEAFASPPTDAQVDATIDYLASLGQCGRWSGERVPERCEMSEYNPDLPLGTKLLVDSEPSSLIARTKDGWYHFNEESCSACLISRNDKDALLKILDRDAGDYEGTWRDSPWPCGCDEDEGVFTIDVVKPEGEESGEIKQEFAG